MVPQNKTLTIQGDGKLTVTSNGQGAGIGGEAKIPCGNIIIKGGDITATGGNISAAIGGGYSSSCGDITITDGVIRVKATKGNDTPNSIGKGYNGTCGTVTIGGVVYPDGIAESPYTYIPNKDEFITVYTPTTPIPYSADLEAINYDKIVYQRSFDAERVGKFQAWFVPFDYTITAGDAEKFDFFKINFIANADEEGINPESDKVYVFLNPVAAGKTLQGNMPYVYRPKEAVQNYQFVADGVGTKLLPQNTSVVMETSTTTTTYQFYGTYSNMTATTANPFYYISINGAICYGTDVSVGPFRWLMKATNKSGNPAYYSRSITFVESGTTGIEDISNKRCNETGDFYDLQGRKVAQPSKGLYIVNGRKVVIK